MFSFPAVPTFFLRATTCSLSSTPAPSLQSPLFSKSPLPALLPPPPCPRRQPRFPLPPLPLLLLLPLFPLLPLHLRLHPLPARVGVSNLMVPMTWPRGEIFPCPPSSLTKTGPSTT